MQSILIMLIWIWLLLVPVTQGKISKAMKNILNAEKDKLTEIEKLKNIKHMEEEEEHKPRKVKVRSVKDLNIRLIFL